MVDYTRKREQERIVLTVRVRIWGLDSAGQPFSEFVETVDLTPTAARLRGVHCKLQAGDTIGLQYDDEKARHRVVWVGWGGTATEGMIGLSSLEPERFLWGKVWPKDRPVDLSSIAAGHERRLYSRYACKAGVEFKAEDRQDQQWGTVQDISITGAYIESHDVRPVHSRLVMSTTIEGIRFVTEAVVRSSRPSLGMGIAFTRTTPEHRDRLERIIEILEQHLPAAVPPPLSPGGKNPQPSLPENPPVSAAPAAKPVSAAAPQPLYPAAPGLSHLLPSSADVDPRLMEILRNAVRHAGEISTAVQRWSELKSKGRDPFEVMAHVQAEMVRFAAEIAKQLAMDLEAKDLDFSIKEIPTLYEQTKRMLTGLARALGKHEVAAELMKADRSPSKKA
jgi:hypothetical protein